MTKMYTIPTFNNIQKLILTGLVVVILAVTCKTPSLLFVYICAFCFAHYVTNSLVARHTQIQSQWFVKLYFGLKGFSSWFKSAVNDIFIPNEHGGNCVGETESKLKSTPANEGPNECISPISDEHSLPADGNSNTEDISHAFSTANHSKHNNTLLSFSADYSENDLVFHEPAEEVTSDDDIGIENYSSHNPSGDSGQSYDVKRSNGSDVMSFVYDHFETVSHPADNESIKNISDQSFVYEDSSLQYELGKIKHEAFICVDYIVRDFLCKWYHSISDDNEIVEESRLLLRDLVRNTAHRLCYIDKFEFIECYISLFQCHLHDYQQAVSTYQKQPSYRKKKDQDRREFKKLKSTEECFDSLNKFHYVLKKNSSEAHRFELCYMRCLVDVILSQTMDPTLYQCFETKDLLVETLVCNVFLPVVDLFSQTHWLHQAIILLFSEEDIELIPTIDEEDKLEFPGSIQRPNISLSERDLGESFDEQCPNEPEQMERTSEDGNYQQDEYFDITNESNSNQEVFITSALSEYCQLDSSQTPPKKEICSTKKTFYLEEDDDLETEPVTSFLEPKDPEECSIHSEGSSGIDSLTGSSILNWSSNSPSPVSFTPEQVRVNRVTDSSSDFLRPLLPITRTPSEFSEPDLLPEEAVEVSQDDFIPTHLFLEVEVMKTETRREPGGNGLYTLYCIKANSWKKLRPDSNGPWMQQLTRVKRRYREFLILQERLEDHPLYRKSVKGIKGPSRWNALPLGNLGKDTVKKRHIFLDQYLKDLVVKEDISSSLALREFLAYDGDASIAYVKKAHETRLDQVLVKTMSGVFDKISSVLDSIPDDLSRSRSTGRLPKEGEGALGLPETLTGTEDTDDLSIEIVYGDNQEYVEFSHVLSLLIEKTDLTRINHQGTASSLDNKPPGVDETRAEMPSGGHLKSDDPNQAHPDTEDCSQLPLMTALLSLALRSIESRETWTRKERVVHLFNITLGHAFEYWLRSEIDDVTTEDKCATYIRKLRDVIWPDGRLDDSHQSPPSDEQREVTRKQATRCLRQFFPAYLQLVIGREEFEGSIDEIMACIDHPKLNRHFFYCFLDVVVQKLFPEINIPAIQEKLLNQDAAHLQKKSKTNVCCS